MEPLTPGTGPLVEKINRGEVKALLVDSDERLPILPNVPTFQEAGLPRFTARTWLGLFAPKGSSPDVVGRLSQAFGAVIKDGEFQKRYLLPYGFWPIGSSPDEFANLMNNTERDAADLVRLSGVEPQP